MQRLDAYQIVPAGPGDAQALGEVHVLSWRETYPGLLPAAYLARMDPRLHARRWRGQLMAARPGEVVLAAEGRDGVVGYCAGMAGDKTQGAEDRSAEVHTLYVVRAAQNRGVGRGLLGAAARTFQAIGATSLHLWVLRDNAPARAFYAHLGGLAVAERPVRGWGGGLTEVAYRWTDITALAGAA